MPIERWQVEHGTPGGERWHYRHGEKPCETCREKRNERNRVRNRALWVPRVHAATSAGTPRCGHTSRSIVAGAGQEITCGSCLLLLEAAR